MEDIDISFGEKSDAEQPCPREYSGSEGSCEEQNLGEPVEDLSGCENSITRLFLQRSDNSCLLSEELESLISTYCYSQQRPSIQNVEQSCAILSYQSNFEAKKALKSLPKNENSYFGANRFYKLRVAKSLPYQSSRNLNFMVRPAFDGFQEYKMIDLRESHNIDWNGNAFNRPWKRPDDPTVKLRWPNSRRHRKQPHFSRHRLTGRSHAAYRRYSPRINRKSAPRNAFRSHQYLPYSDCD